VPVPAPATATVTVVIVKNRTGVHQNLIDAVKIKLNLGQSQGKHYLTASTLRQAGVGVPLSLN